MNEHLRKSIGQRIKQSRKALHLTQETIAEQLGVSIKHFSEAERGVAGLSVENLAKLSDLLGCSLDYLVKGQSPGEYTAGAFVSTLFDAIPREKEAAFQTLLRAAVQLTEPITDDKQNEPDGA